MPADLVFLTGASGFVGAHVADELLRAGYRIRALARDKAELPEGCEPVVGDLRDVGGFARSLRGARYLVHCAALYSLALRDREPIARVNVAGSESLLAAAHLYDVERAVVTSSSAAVGHERNGVCATEENWAETGHGAYHDSKLRQERVAFAARVPIVTVLPTAPVGPRDRRPTPTGKLVLDFARGRIFAKPPGRGGMNIVAVQDVARAHVAALEQGRIGERYLVGGENLSYDQLWELLAGVCHRSAPRWRAPKALAYAVGYADAARCAVLPHAQPFAPLEGVRLSSESMYADSSKAIAELAHNPSSVRDALAGATEWFAANGYL